MSKIRQSFIRYSGQALAGKYHPDKFADTDPVIQELAKGKMAEINRAYGKIMETWIGRKGGG